MGRVIQFGLFGLGQAYFLSLLATSRPNEGRSTLPAEELSYTYSGVVVPAV